MERINILFTFAVFYISITLKQSNKMIEIQDISFKYAGTSHHIFDNFNLKLDENRIYGLLGKNGTGKSTLLYLISGLLRANTGSIMMDRVKTERRMPDILSEIFIVPEVFRLPKVSLVNYVKMNRAFYPKFSDEILNNCLKDFELSYDIKLNELSMGQAKKAFMSFALATDTKLLLMDEPTNGLDIPSKSQFRKVVAGNMTDNRTVIISTHQVHDVEQLLDHILMLDGKDLKMNASVADICDKYKFEYRTPDDMADVIYAEPTLQGNAVIAPRGDSEETPLNLELLFDAVTKGAI